MLSMKQSILNDQILALDIQNDSMIAKDLLVVVPLGVLLSCPRNPAGQLGDKENHGEMDSLKLTASQPLKMGRTCPSRKWIIDSNHWFGWAKMFVSGRVGNLRIPHRFQPPPVVSTPPKKTYESSASEKSQPQKISAQRSSEFYAPKWCMVKFPSLRCFSMGNCRQNLLIYVYIHRSMRYFGISEWFIIVSYFSSTPWKVNIDTNDGLENVSPFKYGYFRYLC